MSVALYDVLPGDTLVTYDGEASWTTPDDETRSCTARVEFSWAAGTLIHLEFLDEARLVRLNDSPGVLTIGDTEVSNLVMLDETTAVVNTCVVGDIVAHLDELVFHVCNFVPYLDLGEVNPGRLAFEHNGWITELTQMPDARERLRNVRRIGGGSVTHVGTIRKSDGTFFTWSESEETLSGFGHFLSWSASDRVPLLLPVGVRNSRRVLEVWDDPRRSSGRTGIRWFSAHHPETLPAMWPRFADMWADREWRAALTVATELYAASHHGAPLELRIVTAWAALEVVAWQWLTRVENIDADAVDSKKADWRVRRMLTSMRVPTEIRPSMKALRALTDGHDGPKTIAELRNRVVHPKDGSDILDISNEAKQQAWSLSLWCVELALMKLCGWDGAYLDRTQPLPIWEGNVSYPPWTRTTGDG